MIPCTHETIGADPKVVTFHECHHVYKRGDKELDSVTRVIKACFPVKPSYFDAQPDVLENARERGIAVDRLVTAYLRGTLTAIPAGTRQDATTLFFKVKAWLDSWECKGVPQVIVADEDIAGTADIVTTEGGIWDLKTTYNVSEPTYELQLGLYALLFKAQFGELPSRIGIIHLTERFAAPRIVPLDVKQCVQDAAMIRDVWLMAQRRTRK